MKLLLTEDQEDDVVLAALKKCLQRTGIEFDSVLLRSFNHVIAYYSVPDEWEDGVYDSP